MLKLINFIKTYFLYIVSSIIAVCLVGVGVYSYTSTRKQKDYKVTYTVYGKDTIVKNVVTKGFPNLEKFGDEFRLSDFNGPILETKDSITVNSINLK